MIQPFVLPESLSISVGLVHLSSSCAWVFPWVFSNVSDADLIETDLRMTPQPVDYFITG
jgi:hypothetical protein